MIKYLLLFLLVLVGCASTPEKDSKREAAVFSGTDCHMHVHSNSSDEATFDGKRATLALEGASLQRACILGHSFNRRNNPACWNNTKRQCSYDPAWVRKTNEWTLNEGKKFPQLIPFCGIEIGETIDNSDEIKFCKEQGARGIKIHIEGLGLSLTNKNVRKAFFETAKLAGDLNLIVLVHAGLKSEDEAKELLSTTQKLPQTKFILAHMLGRNYQLLASAPLENVYVEISATIIQQRKDAEKVVTSLRAFGIDRVLFGSDWPVIHPAETFSLLSRYPFTKNEITKIRSENANRLLGIPLTPPEIWTVGNPIQKQ